jgi:hypothetical protein
MDGGDRRTTPATALGLGLLLAGVNPMAETILQSTQTAYDDAEEWLGTPVSPGRCTLRSRDVLEFRGLTQSPWQQRLPSLAIPVAVIKKFNDDGADRLGVQG